MVRLIARRGSCDRLRTGCVIVGPDNHGFIGMGYNGSPPGTATCDEVGHLMHEGHCVRTIHAEENALLNAKGCLLEAVVYCTHRPCPRCATKLAAAGVAAIYYLAEYPEQQSSIAIFERICEASRIHWNRLEP